MKIYKYIILLAYFLMFIQPASASTTGNAVSFNGSSEYASVNNSSELNLTSNGTWEFWVNRSATSDETLLSKTGDYLNNGFYISLSSGVVYYAQVS